MARASLTLVRARAPRQHAVNIVAVLVFKVGIGLPAVATRPRIRKNVSVQLQLHVADALEATAAADGLQPPRTRSHHHKHGAKAL